MPSSVPIHSLEIGTSCCVTCTTSTSGGATACAISWVFERPTVTKRALTITPIVVHVTSMCFHTLGICTSPHAPSNVALDALKNAVPLDRVCQSYSSFVYAVRGSGDCDLQSFLHTWPTDTCQVRNRVPRTLAVMPSLG